MAIISAPNQNITYLLFDGDTIIDRMILNTTQHPHTARAAREQWRARLDREGNENLRVAVVLGGSNGKLFNDEQVRGKE